MFALSFYFRICNMPDNNLNVRKTYLFNIYIYTLTGHFIRYTLLVPGWILFCLQNCLNSSWHRFNRVWKHCSEMLVHIDMIASHSCCRFVHDVNLSFLQITKLLYWIEIWWLWRLIMFFQSSIVRFWWSCVNCILRVLFLSDRSGTRCGLLLLEPICLRVWRVVCSEMVFCTPWL